MNVFKIKPSLGKEPDFGFKLRLEVVMINGTTCINCHIFVKLIINNLVTETFSIQFHIILNLVLE